MDTSWLSETSSGMFNYLYEQITGDEEIPRTTNSLSALSKGVWITDLPMNDYEPLENSPVAKQIKRERELEDRVATLEAECSEKDKQIKKAKKNVLLAKGNHVKTKREVEKLNTELQCLKANEMKLRDSNSCLEQELQQLQETLKRSQLSEKSELDSQRSASQKICELQNHLAYLKAEFEKQIAENKSKNERMELTFKANEANLREANSFLRAKVQKLQEKLEESYQSSEIRQACLSQEVCVLNDNLAAYKTELGKQSKENKILKVQMALTTKEKDQRLKKAKKTAFLAKGNLLKTKAEAEKLNNELKSIKECENNLKMKCSSLEQELSDLQNKVDTLKAENTQLLVKKTATAKAGLSEKTSALNSYSQLLVEKTASAKAGLSEEKTSALSSQLVSCKAECDKIIKAKAKSKGHPPPIPPSPMPPPPNAT